VRPRSIVAVRILLLAALLPLACGYLIPTYRDAVVTHLPARAATAESIRGGYVPFVHPYASCGQPLLGNPNFAVLLPDTLLLTVLPLPIAFGLHFALALVLAAAGARRWARAEGAPALAAELAGYAFALGGPVLSAWTFYNSGMALALAPWVLAAAARLRRRVRRGEARAARRTTAELGLWGALEILAGEPVIALLTFGLVLLRGVLPGRPRAVMVRRAGLVAAGLALALALAAPQIFTAGQASRGSSRDLAPYSFRAATETSVHPARLVEQLVPFVFGRPDRIGPGGYEGHRYTGGHAPYLWSLHLGWGALLVLVLHGRLRSRSERFWGGALLVALALSFGRFLPLAENLYGPLSLGGRLRYPVKWWYVVALALVPLVALAARRWEQGEPVGRVRRRTAVALVVFSALAIVGRQRVDAFVVAGLVASVLALGLFARGRGPGATGAVATLVVAGLAAHAPILLTVLDRPPRATPAGLGHRVFERIGFVQHPPPTAWTGPPRATRLSARRARPELWALTGALDGVEYAFDRDPDGSYAFHDRVVREAVDQLPWSERARELRLAGVGWVATDEILSEPYREERVLDEERGVRLYEVPDPVPRVRLASRIRRSPHFQGAVAIHRHDDFDLVRDTVIPGDDFAAGASAPGGRVTTRLVRPGRLHAVVDSPGGGVLVWNVSYHPAWEATVDGTAAAVVPADGHLVGIAVEPGVHDVRVVWDRAPLRTGVLLFLAGCLVAVRLRRG
jgi:hypothetical protein